MKKYLVYLKDLILVLAFITFCTAIGFLVPFAGIESDDCEN